MTHLSDASYTQRIVLNFALLFGEICFIWKRDRFFSMRLLAKDNEHRMKGVSTLLMLMSQAVFLVYDILASIAKYNEGFSMINGEVLSTPFKYYSEFDRTLILISNSIVNISWCFKSSAMFLALAVWNFAVCSLSDFERFAHSLEFRLYIFYSVFSIFLYSGLQFIFAKNELLSTIAPQFVHHFECFALAIIMKLTNLRFANLAQNLSGVAVQTRLKEYRNNNHLLIIIVLWDGISLLLINLDIVVNPFSSSNRLIYNSKILTDLLTNVFSVSFLMSYPLVIMNLHPRNPVKRSSTSDPRRRRPSQSTSRAGSVRSPKHRDSNDVLLVKPEDSLFQKKLNIKVSGANEDMTKVNSATVTIDSLAPTME